MRGLGDDWTDVRDDLLAIGMRLSELTAQSRQGSPSLRIEIPAGTKWENIQIRFLSAETIEIKAPNLRRHFNFAELGFEDRRTQRTPNKVWLLFHALAGTEDNEIPRPVFKPAQVEKGVQALRNRLKDLFGLDDDPFLPYRKAKCYTPKFKLSILSLDDH